MFKVVSPWIHSLELSQPRWRMRNLSTTLLRILPHARTHTIGRAALAIKLVMQCMIWKALIHAIAGHCHKDCFTHLLILIMKLGQLWQCGKLWQRWVVVRQLWQSTEGIAKQGRCDKVGQTFSFYARSEPPKALIKSKNKWTLFSRKCFIWLATILTRIVTVVSCVSLQCVSLMTGRSEFCISKQRSSYVNRALQLNPSSISYQCRRFLFT